MLNYQKLAAGAALLIAVTGVQVMAQTPDTTASQPATDAFLTVNNQVIPKAEFYSALEVLTIPSQLGEQSAGTQVAQKILNDTLVLQFAAKKDAVPTDEQIASKLEWVTKQAGGNLDMFLTQTRSTIDEIKHKLRIEQAFINVVTKGITIPDADVRRNYDDLLKMPKSSFKTPDRVQMAIISNSDIAKLKRAHKLLKDGGNFGKVAAQVSDDPAAKSNQGQMGWVTADSGQTSPEVFAVGLKQGKGKFSVPVKAGKKWYVVKTEDLRPGKVTPFADVKDLLKEQMAIEKGSANPETFEEFQTFVREAKITVSSEKYQSVVDDVKARAAPSEKKVPDAGKPTGSE